jgi:hypothetical protein
MEILDDLSVSLDAERVMQALNLGGRRAPFETLIQELLDRAFPVAKPKILFKVSYIDGRDGDSVSIDGVWFQSGILRKNLEEVERVFPYIVTAGRELETITIDKGDVMQKFCFDAIKECILEDAYLKLETYIHDTFQPGSVAHMNPGSLQDWPISQQPLLFSLFGDVEDMIGVTLTSSNLMDPIKSVSGIQFPTEVDFKSCKLCTRHPCVKRRAPYDPELAARYRGE